MNCDGKSEFEPIKEINIHNPVAETKAQIYLSKAAYELRLLNLDDWAEDIEQAARSIQKEIDEIRRCRNEKMGLFPTK